jgi:hypothetical protein
MKMSISRLFAIGVLGVVTMAGCAAADPAPAAADGQLRAAGGICPTLDYGHATAPADYYRFFDSDAKAGEYVDKIIRNGALAELSGPDARFKEIATDPHLVRLVAEVFEGFKKVFPREMEGLTTPPRVAVVESEIINAFALGPGFAEDATAPADRSPWIFLVHTAALNNGNTDSELRGLFAHELGHLILRTFLPEIQQRVRAIYMLGRQGEDGVLGAAEDDDPRVAAHVEKILELQTRIGGLPHLGFPATVKGQYSKIFDLMMRSVTAPTPESTAACTAVTTGLSELRTAQIALLPGAPLGNLVPATPTPEQRANLDALSSSIASAIPACVAAGEDEGTLMQLTAVLNKLPMEAVAPEHPDHARLIELMVDAERQVDAEAPAAPMSEKMLRAEALMRAEQIALRDDPAFPIDQIRVFDYEEDADDAAVRVLTAIGDDPLGISGFLLSTVPREAREGCVAHVAAGKPVSFGRFIDTHSPVCWRHYHAAQFSKALAACSPEATAAKVLPRGSGRASIVDRVTKPAQPGYGIGRR